MENLLYIALFAPLVGSLFAALFGMSPKNLITGFVTSGLLFISWLASVLLLIHVISHGTVSANMMEWISAGNLTIDFGFQVDAVTAIMMVVVTTVSTVVHIYSIGYMEHDKSFNRFFSYLSAFVFSMMILVMSDNFAGLFIGWEGVGVCSWLLIGFWYHKADVGTDVNPSISPSWAANEAFIMNRIADLGMLVGIFLIYWNVGSLNYNVFFEAIPSLNDSLLVAIGIALFIGAMGKSAQFPLHTWLADAMEGPTPVSALIHAATMVTAGVYLVIRANPLYGSEALEGVSLFIAYLGTFVAIFAASMALVNRDLKRIIAYSTLSQLGYMFAAAGLGAYWVALFHLAAHAFFKALLFLGAGNVMHAMHDELDIFKMGGLKKVMGGTYLYMGLASLALAGIFPLAGFFSKDTILEVAINEDTYFIWFILWATAGLTAFYSFRQVFLTFTGNERYKEIGAHPHEMPIFVLVAMAPLAILAVIFGFFMEPFNEFVTTILPSYHMSEDTHHIAWFFIIITTLIALSGILYAYKRYASGLVRDEELENSFVYRLLTNQYYIPAFYNNFIAKPYKEISDLLWNKVDMKIVDALVDAIAYFFFKNGDRTRRIQSGNLSHYLNWMSVGAVLLMVFAILASITG
ncbi:NADH-ubiquinone oxidoreductase chain L [hydrothermal vent metagenome]|uniref:NADH-ubiquinone oxidoreductase chain L n=1 Tax=hydrothermal vent metagenome TaxID=652676 RepID=A0A1W1EIC9_9ZZZZ